MRKIFSLLFAFLCIVLVSCHSKTEKNAFVIPDEFDMSREYQVDFWAKNDTNMTQVEIYKNAIAEFETYYPNIKVNLRLYTDYSKIYNDVITNIATDTTPNVCITYPDHIATYITGGDTVVNLDELISHKDYGLGGGKVKFDAPKKEEILPKFLEECNFNGHYFALPYMRSSEACYVNKTYVEKLGFTLPETLTWDFIFEVSRKAMEKDADGNYKVNGQKVLIPVIYKSTDNMMIQMLYQKNAGYSKENGEIEIFNTDTKEIIKIVAENSKLGTFNTFKQTGYPANFLNAGQCIFAIDSTAGATWMGYEAPLVDIAKEKLVEFETAVKLIPQFDTSAVKMISQGPSICVFNKSDPQEVLASWLFAQFMLTNRVQIDYSMTEGYLPVTNKALNDPEYQKYLSCSGEDTDVHYSVKIDAVKLILDNMDNTFVTPVFNGSASLRNAAGQLIEDTNKNVRRGKNVDDEFIETLWSDVSALYRLDEISTSGKAELGKMPVESKILIASLVIIWTLMAFLVIFSKIRNKN